MNRPQLSTVRKWIILASSGLLLTAISVIGATTAGLSLGDTLRWTGGATIIIVGFVTITISVGAMLVNFNWMIGQEKLEIPEPETTTAIPQTGSDLNQIINRRLPTRTLSPTEQQQLRARLQRTAITTIARTSTANCQKAEKMVDSGEWTTNQAAAAFLGRVPPPRSTRMRKRVSSQLAFQHGLRQTATAIIAVANQPTRP